MAKQGTKSKKNSRSYNDAVAHIYATFNNTIINISDTITKINIIAESANAAALLGDAESKLSQMMEGSGLKLASLQTQTNQFGGNHKGKGHAPKLASTSKKTNIEDSSKPTENINKLKSENEGLNLIA